ncbi:rho guanine nucleotide exchange factor 26-like isoform X2 [Xenia sp. Carnegie-2017]|uniref:rho guanine nucleotide exchange factor 26-like isoform X2 n=1 Tax=Xenia sp. Carnegie-2017 TaxID=2897299 RepID=UPI001F046C9E|nr:rho guanine nucleotide exchange factor 26-like isoform X2 [Xenia sp. Carnegie-2017]
MNMTETKTKPLPKPRYRNKSSPSSLPHSTNQPPISSSAHVQKPPLKPKPAKYKQLKFNNKGLVSITADIHIDVESPSNSEKSKNTGAAEINCPSVNAQSMRTSSQNGSKNSENKVISSLGGKNNVSQPQTHTEAINKLPPKPPRLPPNDSRLDVNDNEEKKSRDGDILSFKTNIVQKNIPALPRKPNFLRKSIDNSKITSQFYVESAQNESFNTESELTIDEQKKPDIPASLTTWKSKDKDDYDVTRDIESEKSPDQVTSSTNMTSSKHVKLVKRTNSSAGETPPLPRKPVSRPPLPNSNKHSQNNVKIDTKNGNGHSVGCHEALPYSSSKISSLSPNKDTNDNSLITKVDAQHNQAVLNSSLEGNEVSKWNQGEKSSVDEMEKSMVIKNNKPRRPPPGPPPRPLIDRSPPSRPLPSLPKQPSLGSKRSSAPPPLPNSHRPVSVFNVSADVMVSIRRTVSSQDIAGDDSDDDTVYCETDDFITTPKPAVSANVTGEVDQSDYEQVDYKFEEELMDSGSQIAQMKSNQKNKTDLEQVEKTKKSERVASTTYSSSSDDSEHEYVEPIFQRSAAHLSTAVPVSEEVMKNDSSSTNTKEDQFKPWSEEKVIEWDYEGESDDSVASYDEPDDDFDDDDFEDFEGEPLYQVYQAVALKKERTLSLKRPKRKSSEQTYTLGHGTLRGGKMLWSQLPDVRNSGLLENMTIEQRKYQEAVFEVLSSEVSYLKSLKLLVEHFLQSPLFSIDSDDSIMNEFQVSELISNIYEIVKVSERFLGELRSRQRESVVIDSISDIVTDHANNHFDAYVTYCSKQYKQDRALTDLKQTNWRFAEALSKLERDPCVLGLTLQSFLVLPMQRVTRYPLLVDAIVRRCEPGHKEYYKTDTALKAVNQVVHKCNEGARKEERKDEMIEISKIIAFIRISPIRVIVDDRWLLRRGPLQLLEDEKKSTFSNTLRGRFKKYRVKPIYLFLFNDLLIVTKKKTDELYSVIDYAKRSMIRVQESTSKATNAFLLVLLENLERKTKELSVRADNETDLTRWKEAFNPPSTSNDDETIYGSWDCPQVNVIHNYQAQQSDELSLVPGDVVNVLRKLTDGWYEGERIRDGVCGWFPANHTEEIRNEHVRARNLHQRYRLLAASTAFLDTKKR